MRGDKYESYNFIVNKIFIVEFKSSCKLNFIGVWIDEKIFKFLFVNVNFIVELLINQNI